MAQTHAITMTGGCPWGFRLYGGEGDPLLVAKLRKRSKADLAGMREGDVLLCLNNISCRSISHGDAMTLVDNAGSSLVMDVLRGVTSKVDIDAALVAAESRAQKLGPSSLSRPAAQSLVNGTTAAGSTTQVTRREETVQEGAVTRRMTTETRTQRVAGSTTLTKVVREVVTEPAARVPVWAPAGRTTVTAPSGVSVQKNADDSFTMTIGLDKENVAPRPAAPMFNVSKIGATDGEPALAWQPSAHPTPAPRPAPELPPDSGMLDGGDGGPPEEKQRKIPHSLHLSRILHEGGSGSDDCSTPGSPFSLAKKKLFADSAFYDDPEHKYPTIEEQIKMARSVALSLTSPANVKARGHTMFVKRQERSEKWITDESTTPQVITHFTFEESSDEEKYYNPNPWQPSHTWTAPAVMSPVVGGVPPAPAMPPGMWQAPARPAVSSHSEKASVLSADEFERVRLYEEKVEHTGVSPQLCFDLANDLRNMKGKGGRLFAKRRAKSEKWIVDETHVASAATPELIKRLTGGMSLPGPAATPAPGAPSAPDGGAPPRNRLAEMIEMPMAKCSPWDAALESPFGNIGRAFEHIDEFDTQLQQMKAAAFTPQAARKPGPAGGQANWNVKVATSSTSVESKNTASQSWSSSTSQSSYVTSSNSSFPSSTAPFLPTSGSTSRYKPVQFNSAAPQPTEATQRPITTQDGICDL